MNKHIQMWVLQVKHETGGGCSAGDLIWQTSQDKEYIWLIYKWDAQKQETSVISEKNES